MSEHTPIPWEWDQGDVGIDYSARYCTVYKDGGDLIIAEVNDKFSRKEGRANAARIVACVNAFPDDLPTSAIAALNPEAVRALVDGRVVAALKDCRSALDALMGDTDLPEDYSEEFRACQKASLLLAELEPTKEEEGR